MLKKWVRFRTIVTSVTALIGIGFLVCAWLALGRLPGKAVVDFAAFGLILPFGFYGVFTLVGWQRSVADGATPPGPFIAWCVRHQLGPIAPILFMFVLMGMLNDGTRSLERVDGRSAEAEDGVDAGAFQASCVDGARQSLRKAGGDPNAAGMKVRIEHYCGCMATKVLAQYTQADLMALMSDDKRLETDTKYNAISGSCM
jgi:hypothetical protein